MSEPKNSIVFVHPCHDTPIGIESLDELTVELRKDEDDPTDPGAWWIKQCCCGDCYDSEADALRALDHYKRAVFKASIRNARAVLERKIEAMREDLQREVEQFADWHDPEAERVYVAALWGKEGDRFVANHNVSDFDELEDALHNVGRKAERLIGQGYAEVANDEPLNGGMKACRKFVRGDSVRYAGCFTTAVRRGRGGSYSTETEGAYLCAH